VKGANLATVRCRRGGRGCSAKAAVCRRWRSRPRLRTCTSRCSVCDVAPDGHRTLGREHEAPKPGRGRSPSQMLPSWDGCACHNEGSKSERRGSHRFPLRISYPHSTRPLSLSLDKMMLIVGAGGACGLPLPAGNNRSAIMNTMSDKLPPIEACKTWERLLTALGSLQHRTAR